MPISSEMGPKDPGESTPADRENILEGFSQETEELEASDKAPTQQIIERAEVVEEAGEKAEEGIDIEKKKLEQIFNASEEAKSPIKPEEGDRRSSVQRVVGLKTLSKKEKILKAQKEEFKSQRSFKKMNRERWLSNKEREKTPEELEIISIVNEATNEILQKYGVDPFNIPPGNVHVMKKNVVLKLFDRLSPINTRPMVERGDGISYHNMEAIEIIDPISKIQLAHTVFHEMIHSKSYNAVQVTSGENRKLVNYRFGLEVVTRDGENRYFKNLNEAVIEELTKRFTLELFDNPIFAEETKQTDNLKNNLFFRLLSLKAFSSKSRGNEETYYARADKKSVISNLLSNSPLTKGFTYPRERGILNTLIDKIYKKNIEEFKDKEEVFDIFSRGMITGNILPIGGLIERTFGKGTFRKIGGLDGHIKKQKTFVDSL